MVVLDLSVKLYFVVLFLDSSRLLLTKTAVCFSRRWQWARALSANRNEKPTWNPLANLPKGGPCAHGPPTPALLALLSQIPLGQKEQVSVRKSR